MKHQFSISDFELEAIDLMAGPCISPRTRTLKSVNLQVVMEVTEVVVLQVEAEVTADKAVLQVLLLSTFYGDHR